MSKHHKSRRPFAPKPAPTTRWKRADKLPGLTRPQSKLLNYLVNGWQLVVSRNGVKRVRRSKQKVDYRDFLALVKRGFLTATGALTVAGKALCDHFGIPVPVKAQPTPPAPAKRMVYAERNGIPVTAKPSAATLLANAVAALP